MTDAGPTLVKHHSAITCTPPLTLLDLTEHIELAGDVRAELWVATEAPSADCVARLCVVDCCGSRSIAEGIQLIPLGSTSVAGLGATFRVEMSLRSIAARVETGRRIPLHGTFGSAPQWSINPQAGAPPEWISPTDGRPATHAVRHDADRPSRLVITAVPA